MTVEQSGPVTPFRVAAWFGNGVIADGGDSTGPFVSSLAMFDGPQTPFSISSQSGPGIDTGPHSEFSITQTDGMTTFSFQGVNGGAAPSVAFDIGGVLIPFPQPIPGATSIVLTASQAITAPALVNISSSFQVRPANAITGLPAHGFISSSVADGGQATVFFTGLLPGFSGLPGGQVFLSGSGGITTSPPDAGAGTYAQLVGIAVGPGAIFFAPDLMNGPI